MGRITIFSLEDCPHCKRTKATLNTLEIPYVDINLTKYPDRRNDMLQLSDRLTVPQVFFNDKHIGGADETLELLTSSKKWKDNPKETYQQEIASMPDPTDPRLQPSTGPPTAPEQIPPPPRNAQNVIPLPTSSSSSDDNNNEKKFMSILEMTELLKSILPIRELKHNLTVYKNAFKGNELIDALLKNFDDAFSGNRQTALMYGKDVLQQQFNIFGHVLEESSGHVLDDTPALFFRLTCHQTPNILNSYRKTWTERVDPDPIRLVKGLKSQLSKLLNKHTDASTGKVNYKQAAMDPDFPSFEEAVCELKGIELSDMEESMKLAFCINVYNLMIKYAFTKVGIGASNTARYSFFNNVQFQIGSNHVYSFQDLENGILRGNRKAPYAFSTQFSSSNNDPRLDFIMKSVDCRIHFALNCGAASCPPVKFFTAQGIQEELRIVALAFCEENVKVMDDNDNDEIRCSKIFSWYIEDFGGTNKELLKTIIPFTRGSKQEALQRIYDKNTSSSPKIKFDDYDWSTDASDFVPFSGSNVKANASRFL